MIDQWSSKADLQGGWRPWSLKAQSWSRSEGSSLLLPGNHRATLKSIFCRSWSKVRCQNDANLEQIEDEARSIFDAVIAQYLPIHSSGRCGTGAMMDKAVTFPMIPRRKSPTSWDLGESCHLSLIVLIPRCKKWRRHCIRRWG